MAKLPERRTSIDPTVADMLRENARKQTERALPLKDRQRRTEERKKIKARNRVTWDIPETVQADMERLAQQKGCPASQVVELLLRSALSMIGDGAWSLADYPAIASKSPRYEVNLRIAETLDKRE